MLTVVRISLLSFLLFIGGVHAAQAAVATNCTLYAAATGKDTNSGTSPTTPKTLTGASAASVPGSVVCLLGGTYNLSKTFYPAKNGAASNWIVYKAYGDSEAKLVWTAGVTVPALNVVQFYGSSFTAGKSYIEINGLTIDGGNGAYYGIKCDNSHHLRFIGNTIQNAGGGGIASKYCDYLTTDSNKIFHNGYVSSQSWSSGITYNASRRLDTAPGFHSFVVNNIVSGSVDTSTYHTDGNGIIMDSSPTSTPDTPPVLIANNVVYENGARCILTLKVTNIWTVNNTCYKNGLDLTLNGNGSTNGEVTTNGSQNGYFINNVVYSWNNKAPFQQFGTNVNIQYFKNIYFGGSNDFTYSDPSQFLKVDPLFVNPLVLDPTKDGQYATALSPAQLGNGLTLQGTSPAIDKGIDPTKLSGISAELIAGLKQYVLQDISGTPRPQGSGFDAGAYEYTPPAAALPAAPNQVTAVAQ